MTKIRIPPVLRAQAGGAREFQADGSTVGEVLDQLTGSHPALRSQLFDGDNLQRFVNVYLNDEDIQYLEKLRTPVANGDTVIILPAMAGGDR